MTLSEFIEKIGDKTAAKLFDVKERTCQSWRLYYRYPKRDKAELIVKKTMKHKYGPISMEEIFGTPASKG